MESTDAAVAALHRAHQLADLGRWHEALTVARHAMGSPATAGQAYLLAARCLLVLGRLREADRTAAVALTIAPDDSNAHFVRGLTQLSQRRTRKALRSAREAERLDPMSVQAQYLMVLCRLTFGLGHRRRARAAGRRALEIAPMDTLAYEAAGLAAAASGRRHRAAAERHYRAGLALNPADQDLALGLGDVLRRSGRHREANSVYVAAAAIDPSDSRARNRLARLAGPGIVGGGAVGKLALVGNGARVFGSLPGHVVAFVLIGCGLMGLGACGSTAIKLHRNRSLPARVRQGLRGDYVNAVLAWARAAAALLLVATVVVGLDPQGSQLPRPAALVLGAAGGLMLWASLHFRYGPPLQWRDVRAALHLRLRRRRPS